MQLSVIIVNYNVKYFLEQVLLSVTRAAKGLQVETIVVDNNSVDDSVDFIRKHFPEVILIANKENTGFAVANNQGIRISKGKYVLLLNPDTVVGEDTFRSVIKFMDANPNAGGLGIRMIDGKGFFLPESKRGLPTPWVSFCKMTGLGSLFAKSKLFNHYYMGHLSADAIQEIEVLAGAFMWMRRETLEKVGYLDEAFFMYGEDIDLSYRIIQGGYKNYYFPHDPIIHYKGESTKKGSLNYVKVFYNAMIIFARKHFSGSGAQLYIRVIQLAIYLRAGLALLSRFLKQMIAPLLDAFFIYGGMYFIKNFWQNNIKAAEGTGLTYGPEYMLFNVPLYISLWLIAIFLSGGYDKPFRLSRVIRGLIVGTIIISAVYGFLPESLRFSRAMILLGTAWAALATSGWRLAQHFLKNRDFRIEATSSKRVLIVGSLDECQRVQEIVFRAGIALETVAWVTPQPITTKPSYNTPHIGHLAELPQLIEYFEVAEIIFCAQDISNQQIIQYLIELKGKVDFKIVPEGSQSIIGSNSKNTAGDLYALDTHFDIALPRHRRNKKVFDISFCLLLLLIAPILCLLVKHPIGLLKNIALVLLGKKTWAGYHPLAIPPQLPPLKKGILHPLDVHQQRTSNTDTIKHTNLLYAKDYTLEKDTRIIWKAWRSLGRTLN